MPAATPAPSPAQLLQAVERLPQASLLHQQDAAAWVASVLEHDPKRAWRHLERASGFGGSEISVLLGAVDGLFHPFSDAHRLTRAKLLLDPMESPAGHRQRSLALEPVAKEKYRALVEARGGRSREDLLQAIAQYQQGPRDPACPWLVGHPDDIVEEGGKLYLIDYQSPSAERFQDIRTREVPYYYEAQLHHYKNLAEKAGVHIDGLRLFAFGADEWEGVERAVIVKPELCTRLMEIGTHFWNEYVLAGRCAPEALLAKAQSLDELALVFSSEPTSVPVADTGLKNPDGSPCYVDHYPLHAETVDRLKSQLAELGTEIFGHSVLKNETDDLRKMLIRNIRDALPLEVIPPEVTRIDLGPVRVKLDWEYHPERLVEAIHGALALAGSSDVEIQRLLEAENFSVPPALSMDALVRLLKDKKGIDVENDPEFAPAVLAPRKFRIETLVSLLKDLERRLSDPIRWSELIDYQASQLNVELVRAPVAGVGRELREQTAARFREVAVPAVREISADHVRQAQELAEAAGPAPAKLRRRAKP